jgi:esterase/lipase superfamily enzyme
MDVNRREVELGPAGLVAYGNWGRPLVVFPSELGKRWDFEGTGMLDAVAPLVEAGRAKVYSVDGADEWSWRADDLPLEERARRHGDYERWIIESAAPWIRDDCGGALDAIVCGCSFGAFHAANFALKRADLFPLAICMSGVYDVSVVGWGERGDAVYFNNPLDYVQHLHGDHLEWLRSRVSLLLVCGQGAWEDTTGALESTKRFAGVLAEKGVPHELDLWGHDVAHDWPSWRAQIAHHLPRFV